MSWVRETRPSNLHAFCMNLLKAGPLPRHIAIIMDGNRRFAVKKHFSKEQGHLQGFDTLSSTLEWCLDFGVTEVTVYAFSIENFKRPKDEVDYLMELVRQKFQRLVQERDLDKYGVCIRVLGNIDLLPLDIQEIIAEGVRMTRTNCKATLNICFSYTSRDEIRHAMQDIAEGVSRKIIRESDISEGLIERCLYSGNSEPPDLLIRTSGEVRLSDFLLWQSGFSVLAFVNVLWPEFSRWHFYAAILHYQRNYAAVQEALKRNRERVEQLQNESDELCVRQELASLDQPDSDIDDRLEQYRRDREDRITALLDFLEQRAAAKLEVLLRSKPVCS